ncbi:MAG: hypothetical protein F6K55_03410 [Moorea sp. SIO4A3]|nr:hypothetical protein [Moorena sp. SIO4A3]
MKKLVETLANSSLRSQKALEVLERLSESLQVEDGRILIGTSDSYIEVGESIMLVSNGRKISLDDLFRIEGLVDRQYSEEDDYEEVDEQEIDEIEMNLVEYQEPPEPPAIRPKMRSTVLSEIKKWSISQRNSGTGGSGNAGEWNRRILNNVNPIVDFCQLDSENYSFRLTKGQYNVTVRMPFVYGDAAIPRLINVDQTIEILGSSVQSHQLINNPTAEQQAIAEHISGNALTQFCWIFAALDLVKDDKFYVEMYIKKEYSVRTLGAETKLKYTGFGNSFALEVYTQVLINKIGE